MIIYNFSNDYSEGCHTSIIDRLASTNFIQQIGYGEDEYSKKATHLLRCLCEDTPITTAFIAGGTLTNLTILSAILKPYESIISATTGHINNYEAGAIEATGHKIESINTTDGKLNPELIKTLLIKTPLYHTVKPKVVYISNSTELGTIYTKKELSELSLFCRSNDLLLFMDGARLAMALASLSNDLSLADISKLTDIFYLGGTKCGALLGEAVIITNEQLKSDFKYYVKQRGAMMAKGRLLGIQFEQLLSDNLIFTLAEHANLVAKDIFEDLKRIGFDFLSETVTNQIFPILPNKLIEKLQNKYCFIIWKKIDDNNSAIRLITSWATEKEVAYKFIEDLKKLLVESESSI